MQLGQASSILYFFPPTPASSEPFILEDGTKNPNSVAVIDTIPINAIDWLSSVNSTDLVLQEPNPNSIFIGIKNSTGLLLYGDSGGPEFFQLNIDANTYLYGEKTIFQIILDNAVNYGFINNQISFSNNSGTLFNLNFLNGASVVLNAVQSGNIAVDKYTEAFSGAVVNTIINTWQAVVLTGAPANSIVDVLVTNASAGVAYNAGVRAVGSSLARIVSTTGSNSCCVTVKTDASGQAEFYSSNLANISFRYLGVHGK